MDRRRFEFDYLVYNNIDELPEADSELLEAARAATHKAYAPYSQFHVGAAAKIMGGPIISGANQENAAYPVALCAERVVLATLSAVHGGAPIEAMAVSYLGSGTSSDRPISPCGMCRQSLQEMEDRIGRPIRMILGGMEGPIYVIDSASKLLPLAFTNNDLQ